MSAFKTVDSNTCPSLLPFEATTACPTFTGTDTDGKTVEYRITSPYRGESYFNPLAGGGFEVYLFKVSSSGYLYTPENTGTVNFSTADDKKANIKYFNYTKKVDGKTTVTNQPITEEVWELMRSECGTDKKSGTTQADTFDRIHKGGENFYQLEVGKEYTIRVKMSVNASGKVTATTYVRPAGSDEAFSLVGSTSYTYNGTTNQAIRFSENSTCYTFDDMKFVKLGACDGKHEFPVILKQVENEGGINTLDEMSCLKCDAVYYENFTANNVLESYDLTNQSDYESFMSATYKTSGGNPAFSDGEGIVLSPPTNITGSNQGGAELTFNLPASEKNAEYRMSFTTKITKLPCDQKGNKGSSFLTDRTGDVFTILLRLGRNSDYDATKSDNEGWLKLRTVAGSQDWGKIDTSYVIKEGETYDFTVVLKPSEGLFDLYINGNFVGTGGMNAAKWNGTVRPYFRLANMMEVGLVLKSYSFGKIEKRDGYDLFKGADGGFTLNKGTLKAQLTEKGELVSKNVIVEGTASSSTLLFDDKNIILGSTPYTISFDFKMTDTGEFKDSANAKDSSLWSLISWISVTEETTNYSTMVRVGGIDNDATKDGFESFFLIMNNKSGYTDNTDNGNQGYTTSAGGSIVGYYTDKNSVFSFTADEWVTITLSVNPYTRSAYLYANGHLVGSAPLSAYSAIKGTQISKSQMRIGDSFRKLFYNWAIKNIEITLTPDTVADVRDSGEIFNVNFGGTYATNSTNNTNLGNIAHTGMTAAETVKDTADKEGYIHFLANAGAYAAGATNLFNLCLTSTLDDGVYYNHVEGQKYAIETEFALYNRAPTDAELEDLAAYNTANKKSYTLPTTTGSKAAALIRLSKYHDNNRVSIIDHGATALSAITASGDVIIFTRDDNGNYSKASAWYTEDQLVDGKIPDSSWMKLKVVIDERDDTYSVYVNDSIAYYKSGNEYKRAENLKLKLTIGANSFAKLYPDAPEMAEFNRTGLYKDLPRSVTVDGVPKSYNFQKLENMCYVRCFQNTLDLSIKSLSVTKIDDGLNFVGVQKRTESETPLAFDLRFVFATDDIYVDAIEYDVTAEVDGVGFDAKQTAVSDTVYKTIRSTVGDVNSWKFDEGDYFSAFTVDGIELASESSAYTFRITPYIVRYNATTGKTERDISSADTTYVVRFNGLGELVDYYTESSEWASLTTVYTDIAQVPYKSLGRTQMLDGKLTADWSASGIEFEATCIGDVALIVSTEVTRNFTVVVDGVEYKDFKLANGTNYLATGLPYGNHTFKVMNQDGYSSTINIEGVTLRGTFGEAPADSELFIEFIGDSITHGCGLASPAYSEGTNDGTLTYAFLAAKELGADYTIMANGGMGVKWGGDYDGANLNRSMKKYPYLNDTKRGTILYEGYERAADLVVIGLSTNDNYRFELQYKADREAFKAENPDATWPEVDAHSEEFTAAKMAELGGELELLIAEIEKNHGKDVPIILARGMMEKPESDSSRELYHTSVEYMTYLIETVWQGKYGDHVIKVAHLTPDRTGYASHPTREGAAIQGADLAEFIRTEFPDLVPAN